ncbi:uncharacterized protein LOC127760563 isoform X2 [Oryza glaberrima]|uniref:uncharacterized protein LOC127760563 isoform X2 n=1 Tax=Oryza glaberrima TaxID=4538 RepID=UPI00224C53D0|nr:uncharacterized protein LOC127760563 isoform X2 [Oryza glaberrima]
MSVPGVASRAADRFYCPPPRRHLLHHHHHQASKAAAAAVERQPRSAAAAAKEEEETNLERFIASTAVRVPAHRLPRTSSSSRERGAAGAPPYYELADLWEAFAEWSAYGAGVPLLLNGTDGVVQYYVPFLSAIQLFAARPPSSTSGLGEDSDGESAQDMSSESDHEHLRCRCLVNSISADQGGFSSDDSESGNQELYPVFQYMEHDAPYGRQPLADMISLLANRFPDLRTYKSCDLLPSSWISVAWYPIYRIPTGPTLQDLDACFLTFHSLSTPAEGTLSGHPETNVFHNSKIYVPGKVTLPLIGLASHKFNGSMWTSNQEHEQQLTKSLLKAADDWLCQRRVNHPDYRFFLSH